MTDKLSIKASQRHLVMLIGFKKWVIHETETETTFDQDKNVNEVSRNWMPTSSKEHPVDV